MVEIVHAAQRSLFQQALASLPDARRRNAEGESLAPAPLQDGGGGAVNGGGGGGEEVCQGLLRRQQARIEELERRLCLPGASDDGEGGDNAGGKAAGARVDAPHPTLTI